MIDTFSPILCGVKSISNLYAVFLYVKVIKSSASYYIFIVFVNDFKCSFTLYCSVKENFEYFFFPTDFVGVLFPNFRVSRYRRKGCFYDPYLPLEVQGLQTLPALSSFNSWVLPNPSIITNHFIVLPLIEAIIVYLTYEYF